MLRERLQVQDMPFYMRLVVQNMPGCRLRKYRWGKWADWRTKSHHHFCTDCIHFLCPVWCFPFRNLGPRNMISPIKLHKDSARNQQTGNLQNKNRHNNEAWTEPVKNVYRSTIQSKLYSQLWEVRSWVKWVDWRTKSHHHFCTDRINFLCPVWCFPFRNLGPCNMISPIKQHKDSARNQQTGNLQNENRHNNGAWTEPVKNVYRSTIHSKLYSQLWVCDHGSSG